MKHEKHASSEEAFELEDAITRYSNHIAADIKSPKRRREVAAEYAAHLEDAVYREMLGGTSARDAFFSVCDRLGEPAKLQEMLACVHNRPPLPSYVRWLVLGLFIALLAVLYFLVESRPLRAWIMLLAQLAVLGISIWALHLAYRALRAVKRRRRTIARLRRYAEAHGLGFRLYGRGYAGIFRPTKEAEVVIDTPDCRYILSLWGTLYARRHLHLTDIGLYMYSRVFGHMHLHTRAYHFFAPGFHMALPKGVGYFSMMHTNLTDVPQGMRLLPEVDWSAHELRDKKNVHILLLSPVPFKTSLLLSGREVEALDGDAFLDSAIYSTEGFLSFLNGERIETDGTFRRAPLGKNE